MKLEWLLVRAGGEYAIRKLDFCSYIFPSVFNQSVRCIKYIAGVSLKPAKTQKNDHFFYPHILNQFWYKKETFFQNSTHNLCENSLKFPKIHQQSFKRVLLMGYWIEKKLPVTTIYGRIMVLQKLSTGFRLSSLKWKS